MQARERARDGDDDDRIKEFRAPLCLLLQGACAVQEPEDHLIHHHRSSTCPFRAIGSLCSFSFAAQFLKYVNNTWIMLSFLVHFLPATHHLTITHTRRAGPKSMSLFSCINT